MQFRSTKTGHALELASAGGHENMVRMLLEEGADVNADDIAGTALKIASAGGHENVVRLLLEVGWRFRSLSP